MIPGLNFKVVPVLPPTSKDNTDFDGNTYIDTQGIGDGVMFLIACGSLAAAVGSTAEGSAPKIEECDTAGGSYTDVTGAALAAAIAGTKDGKVYGIYVNLRKTHKRFMRVNAPHVGNGSATQSYLCIMALAFGQQTAPQVAADMGLEELIIA
jgi:hypothetical protein